MTFSIGSFHVLMSFVQLEFEQSSMVSPFATQQQQMAVLMAQQQAMFMAAAASTQNLQASPLQGQSIASSEEKAGAPSVSGGALGQVWPVGNLQPLSSFGATSSVQNGGLPFVQVGSA